MAAPTTAIHDLGELSASDGDRFEPGAILWGRFCVVGDAHELHAGSSSLRVTDLARELGHDEDQHRLDLHLVPAPNSPEAAARLDRALAVEGEVQPQVLARARVAERLVLVCRPTSGRPLVGLRAVEGRPVSVAPHLVVAIALQLADLLAKLHAAEVYGVAFIPEMLRVDGTQLELDRFDHLLGAEPYPDLGPELGPELGPKLGPELGPELGPDPSRDVAALVELIDELVGHGVIELGRPTTAAALQAALTHAGGSVLPPELPVDPPFVGRLRALTDLARGFDQAQIAKPTALVIRGNRGVGKSRLLREFVAARIAADDSIVLTGAWHERSADSRGGLLAALDQLPKALARLDPDERDDIRRRINRATRHLGAIVTRTAPSLGSVLRNVEQLPPLELGEDFSRHTAVIAELLRAIGTKRRPLLLALDNLEAIDASSAAVLRILSQTKPAHHTLVALGHRQGPASAVRRLELEVQTIELGPLSEDALEQLVIEALPGEVEDPAGLGRALWSVSEGLPLVAWTNLREWVERGRIGPDPDDGVWRARGQLRGRNEVLDLASVFGARLRDAVPGARVLALRIAVYGSELDLDEIRGLGPVAELELDDAITELVARGLLARTSHGVRFPHDTIRELVLEAFGAEDRRAAHTHVAELLIRHKAPIAQIAYHRELGIEPNADPSRFDRLSRLHADAGSERLAVYDLERARWHLERALEHSRDSEQRAIAAEGLADVCLLSDDLDTAVSLYTAIIATAEAPHALRTAAKAVLYLFSKSHNSDARQLGNMALEAVGEGTPATLLGKIAQTLGSLVRSWLGQPPQLDRSLREGLCRLYPYMLTISLVDDPGAFPRLLARARWMALDLDSSSATMVRSFEASMWATFGRFQRADEIFSDARAIAVAAEDHWAHGVVLHNWALASLMPSDRYEEGQDMFDDAIAAFRETGDVSVAILSMLFKGLFGRDREPAERVLGWFGEAVATASRNGKSVAAAPLEALTLHIHARQGRSDLGPRLAALATRIEGEEVSGIDRLMARAHLAFAALATATWELAVVQVRAGCREAGELPGVPDFCQEVYLATGLVLLDRPISNKADRRLLRLAVRKFRAAAKRSPRLRPLGDLLELQLHMRAHRHQDARAVAGKIVRELDSHENLHAAREAHRALSRLFKGDQVLAAAEHERVARNLGRRLGLTDRALASDFSEAEIAGDSLPLALPGWASERSRTDLPAAGMLGSPADQRRRPVGPPRDDDDDVLAAWALDEPAPPSTVLQHLLPPIRDAVRGTIDSLELRCPTPTLAVPFASSDLQILIINMLLTSRDAVAGTLQVIATIELVDLDEEPRAGRPLSLRAGPHLLIRVRASGSGNEVGLVSALSTCESLVAGLGGHLSVSTHRSELALDAYLPTATATRQPTPTPIPRTVVIVHPDPELRETVAAAVAKLGAKYRSFDPSEFEPTKLVHGTSILADAESLRTARALQPFLDVRCHALIKRGSADLGLGAGAQVGANSDRSLRVPFELAELEQLLREP